MAAHPTSCLMPRAPRPHPLPHAIPSNLPARACASHAVRQGASAGDWEAEFLGDGDWDPWAPAGPPREGRAGEHSWAEAARARGEARWAAHSRREDEEEEEEERQRGTRQGNQRAASKARTKGKQASPGPLSATPGAAPRSGKGGRSSTRERRLAVPGPPGPPPAPASSSARLRLRLHMQLRAQGQQQQQHQQGAAVSGRSAPGAPPARARGEARTTTTPPEARGRAAQGPPALGRARGGGAVPPGDGPGSPRWDSDVQLNRRIVAAGSVSDLLELLEEELIGGLQPQPQPQPQAQSKPRPATAQAQLAGQVPLPGCGRAASGAPAGRRAAPAGSGSGAGARAGARGGAEARLAAASAVGATPALRTGLSPVNAVTSLHRLGRHADAAGWGPSARLGLLAEEPVRVLLGAVRELLLGLASPAETSRAGASAWGGGGRGGVESSTALPVWQQQQQQEAELELEEVEEDSSRQGYHRKASAPRKGVQIQPLEVQESGVPRLLSNLAWALSKLAASSSDALLLEFNLLEAAVLAPAASAMPQGGPPSSGAERASPALVHRLSPQHIANISAAFANARHAAPELLLALGARAAVLVPQFSPQELSQTLWAFAVLGQPLPPLLLGSLASWACTPLTSCSQEFLGPVPGQGTAGRAPGPEAVAVLPLSRWGEQQLSNAAWACAVLQHLQEPFFLCLWKEVLAREGCLLDNTEQQQGIVGKQEAALGTAKTHTGEKSMQLSHSSPGRDRARTRASAKEKHLSQLHQVALSLLLQQQAKDQVMQGLPRGAPEPPGQSWGNSPGCATRSNGTGGTSNSFSPMSDTAGGMGPCSIPAHSRSTTGADSEADAAVAADCDGDRTKPAQNDALAHEAGEFLGGERSPMGIPTVLAPAAAPPGQPGPELTSAGPTEASAGETRASWLWEASLQAWRAEMQGNPGQRHRSMSRCHREVASILSRTSLRGPGGRAAQASFQIAVLDPVHLCSAGLEKSSRPASAEGGEDAIPLGGTAVDWPTEREQGKQYMNGAAGERSLWVVEHSGDDTLHYSLDLALPAEKLAVEIDGPSHFTRNTGDALGATVLKQRHLEAVGWVVKSVPYHEWDLLHSAEEKKAYLCSLLSEDSKRDVHAITF